MGVVRGLLIISVSGELLVIDLVVIVLESERVSRELSGTACPPFNLGVNVW